MSDKCGVPGGCPGGQDEGHLAPVNVHFACQPAALEIRAQEKPSPGAAGNSPPSLLAWTHSSPSPTFPENRRHFPAHSALDACREHLIPARSTQISESRVLHHSQGPACEAGDLPALQEVLCLRRSLLTGARPRAQGWSLCSYGRVTGWTWVGVGPELAQRVQWFEFLQLRVANPQSAKDCLCEIGQVTCVLSLSFPSLQNGHERCPQA